MMIMSISPESRKMITNTNNEEEDHNDDDNNNMEEKMEMENNDNEEEDDKDKDVVWCIGAWVTRPERWRAGRTESTRSQGPSGP